MLKQPSIVFGATLFDYNGVLVDDEHVHLEAFRDVLAPLGITLSEADYWSDYLGLDDAGVFREALKRHRGPPSEAQIHDLIEAKRPHYLARADGKLRGFPGAAELLRARADVGPVVIVSGALRSEIELGLELLGVRDRVADIISAEDTTHSKPHPEGYLLGLARLRELGVEDPTLSSIVFEDSLDGVTAALGAGLTCIGIAHSYPIQELQRAGAHHVVATIAEVTPDVLRATWQRRG